LANYPTDEVLKYDPTTGAFLGVLVAAGAGGLNGPDGVAYGPDGNVYVNSQANGGQVLRFDSQTGAFLGVFAAGGGLTVPTDIKFGPDGRLYVADRFGPIYRYDGSTGAFIDRFDLGGGLTDAIDLVFGPTGDLFVGAGTRVARFQAGSGTYLGDFVPAGSGGLVSTWGLAFTPAGDLLVADYYGFAVRRYDGTTGAPLGTFGTGAPGPITPDGLAVGRDGHVYVNNQVTNAVERYDGTTGAFLGNFVAPGSGGLQGAEGLAFGYRTGGNVISGNAGDGVEINGPALLVGTVGAWSAEGSAASAIPTNNGTPINGVAFAPGVVGQAFQFDGNQSAVRMPATALNGAHAALTIEAWVNPAAHGHESSNTWGLTVLSKTDSDGFALRVKDGFVQATLFLSVSGFVNVTFPNQMAALPLGAWSHVAFTYNGAAITGYLNGQSLGSVAASGTIRNGHNIGTTPMIGNEPTGNGGIQGRASGSTGGSTRSPSTLALCPLPNSQPSSRPGAAAAVPTRSPGTSSGPTRPGPPTWATRRPGSGSSIARATGSAGRPSAIGTSLAETTDRAWN
jgi:sugar lactone lactonase YvrE